MNRIRVLETIRQGAIGGGESHVLDVVKYLDKSRFEPIVLSFTEGEMITRLNSQDIQTVVIPTTVPFDIRVWPKVKRLLKEVTPQIIHAHGTRAMSNVLYPSRQLGIPIAYTIHGWSFHDNQRFPVYKFRLLSEQFLTQRATVNVSVSQSNQESGQLRMKGFRSIVIENGIDLDKFNPARQYSNIRKDFGINDHEVVIGFIARFTIQKSPLLLLEAFDRLAARYNNVKLLMVGDGELMPDVKNRVNASPYHDRIILPGFRTDIPDVLNAVDVYCLPSLWEGLPLGLMEAMAMKKAVVATRVDGSREVVDHGKNGLLAEPGNSNDFYEQLDHILADQQLISHLGEQAHTDITGRYEVKAMVRKIENMYNSLLQK